MMTLSQFDATMQHRGWVMLPAVVPQSLIDAMLIDLEIARTICRLHQERNGVAENTVGTVHHLASIPGLASFLTFLENNPAHDYIDHYFGGKPYRLHSFGGNFNPAGSNYAGKVHCDIRTRMWPCPMLNVLVALDDFTKDNGATILFSGSHKEDAPKEPPCDRAIMPAGSILLFDSNLLHAGGENKTDKPRRSVTPLFCRPWYRPEFDYPRALGYDADFSPKLRQILGYNSRVPASLGEFYQPVDSRMYQAGQG